MTICEYLPGVLGLNFDFREHHVWFIWFIWRFMQFVLRSFIPIDWPDWPEPITYQCKGFRRL